MTNKKTIDEQIGNLTKLTIDQANAINTKLDAYLDAEKVLSKSALSVAILISKSGVISKAKIDSFKSISNTEILAFTKRFENGKISIRKNAVGENNPTKYDESALSEMVNIPMNFSEAETWAKDTLLYVETPTKKSKLAQAMINLQVALENSWNEDMTKVTFKADVSLEMNNTFNDLKDFIEQVKKQRVTPKEKIFQKEINSKIKNVG